MLQRAPKHLRDARVVRAGARCLEGNVTIPEDVCAIVGADQAGTTLKKGTNVLRPLPVCRSVRTVVRPYLHAVAAEHERTLVDLAGTLNAPLFDLKICKSLPVAVAKRPCTQQIIVGLAELRRLPG